MQQLVSEYIESAEDYCQYFACVGIGKGSMGRGFGVL